MFFVKIFILVVVTTAIENAEGRTLPVKMNEVVINPARLAEAIQEVLTEKYGPQIIERRPVVKPLSKILSQFFINFKILFSFRSRGEDKAGGEGDRKGQEVERIAAF